MKKQWLTTNDLYSSLSARLTSDAPASPELFLLMMFCFIAVTQPVFCCGVAAVSQQGAACSVCCHSQHSVESVHMWSAKSERKHKRSLVSKLHLASSWFYGWQRRKKKKNVRGRFLLNKKVVEVSVLWSSSWPRYQIQLYWLMKAIPFHLTGISKVFHCVSQWQEGAIS